MGDTNTNQYSRGSASKYTEADAKKSGFSVDPGPWEAIVQGHVEGNCIGQLIVTIPDMSGIVDASDGTGSESNQLTVSYASPFYGTTFGTDQQAFPDSPATAGQSYGMWMVPPDIGSTVLVTFVGGDRSRGYWFACCYNSPSHHMVPANGRNVGGAANTKAPGDQLDAYLDATSVVPVVEYSTKDTAAFNTDAIINTPRYPHEFQTITLANQGLDRDPIRGAISSSSLRESPSNVYGISTPGRKATNTDQIPGISQGVVYRKGGHSFVMDDGDKDGVDQLIRLRTSGGHQILMNDTEKILYIASASGAQWLEFSKNGSINVYAAAGFNLRSSGSINMHSDSNISMCAPSINITAFGSKTSPLAGVSIKSSGSIGLTALTTASIKCNMALTVSSIGAISVTSGAILSLSAVGAANLSGGASVLVGSVGAVTLKGTLLNLNTPPGPLSAVKPPLPALPPIPNSLDDTFFTGKTWQGGAAKVLSTCSVVPAHEPWTRYSPSGSLLGGLVKSIF